MYYILAPTPHQALLYCEEKRMNIKNLTILDALNPWHITEEKIKNTVEDENYVLILDQAFENIEVFNSIMEYLETTDGFTLEIEGS